MHRITAPLLATVVLLCAPASALAGTAYVDGGTLHFVGADAEDNYPRMEYRTSAIGVPQKPDVIVVSDEGQPVGAGSPTGLTVTPGNGCVPEGLYRVACPAAGVGLQRTVPELEDDYYYETAIDLVSYAQRGRRVAASIDGRWNDGVRGERDMIGGDVEGIVGGRANDVLIGNGQDNRLAGGLGNDVLDGFGAHDTLLGGHGRDLLIGRAGYDRLFGMDGADILDGGPDEDSHRGGPGNDILSTRDRGRESEIDCGSGPRDLVVADRFDRQDVWQWHYCEFVAR